MGPFICLRAISPPRINSGLVDRVIGCIPEPRSLDESSTPQLRCQPQRSLDAASTQPRCNPHPYAMQTALDASLKKNEKSDKGPNLTEECCTVSAYIYATTTSASPSTRTQSEYITVKHHIVVTFEFQLPYHVLCRKGETAHETKFRFFTVA